MSTIKICIVTIFLTIVYIIVSVCISNLFFNSNANGSLIYEGKDCIGSKLIGQLFTQNYYFHGRPSLHNYQSDISGNSNSAYYSKELKKETLKREILFKEINLGEFPTIHIITESASGLDPDITEESALRQAERISRTTNTDKNDIIKIIRETSKPRILNLFGEEIVNVFELNLRIRKLYAQKNRT